VKILITGAGGLVGGLAARLAAPKHEVLACDRTKLDVRDPEAVRRAFREFSPEAVLHCAAYTDVDGAESAPRDAHEVNALGARAVAEAARGIEALILYVSTDYVFDGEAAVPYREEDPPRPLSSYGRSKLEGELEVARAAPENHLIVRTGWLYGPRKGFVDWARGRLLSGEELPLIEDRTGSPTSARELASAMLALVEQGRKGVFHFVNAGETSWLGLGRAIAEECGLSPEKIRAIRAADWPRPAARPRYSALSVQKYERTTGRTVTGWRDALRQYLG
jgi:dTDP-4-dehydrorhamnose reductase